VGASLTVDGEAGSRQQIVLKVVGHGVTRDPPVRAKLGLLTIPDADHVRERVSRPVERRTLALVGRGRRGQLAVDRLQRAEEVLLNIRAAADRCGLHAARLGGQGIDAHAPVQDGLANAVHAVIGLGSVLEAHASAGRSPCRADRVVADRTNRGRIDAGRGRAVERSREHEVRAERVAARPDIHGVTRKGEEQQATAAQGASGLDLDLVGTGLELIREVEERLHREHGVPRGVHPEDAAVIGTDDDLELVARLLGAVREVDGQIAGFQRIPRGDEVARLLRREGIGQHLGEAVPRLLLCDRDGIVLEDHVSHGSTFQTGHPYAECVGGVRLPSRDEQHAHHTNSIGVMPR